MGEYSVGIIHNIISPYRIPLFKSISGHNEIDLTVYYCSESHDHRKWDIPDSDTYQHEILNGISFDTKYVPFTYHINPSIIRNIYDDGLDILIIGGCSDFTTQIGYFTAKILDIPVILWSEQISESQSYINAINYPIKKWIASNANSLIVPGQHAKRFHTQLGATPDKIFFAPNIIQNEKYIKKSQNYSQYAEDIKRAHGLENKTIILFVGQLIHRKGVKFLLQAYKKLQQDRSDVALLIVGDGIKRKKFEDMATNGGIDNIWFTGWVSETQKLIYYALSDLFVLPTREDLAPLVLNEAMASGLPVITTDAVGTSEDMIEGGKNGYIVPSEDSNMLYKRMGQLVDKPAQLSSMGERSREIIQERFSIERAVEGFISAINYSMRGI